MEVSEALAMASVPRSTAKREINNPERRIKHKSMAEMGLKSGKSWRRFMKKLARQQREHA